jgi:hypothetical protein
MFEADRESLHLSLKAFRMCHLAKNHTASHICTLLPAVSIDILMCTPSSTPSLYETFQDSSSWNPLSDYSSQNFCCKLFVLLMHHYLILFLGACSFLPPHTHPSVVMATKTLLMMPPSWISVH